MQPAYKKIYISMPHSFLEQVDRTAEEEHLSRSALIREALKLYMKVRSRAEAQPFFRLAQELRGSVAGLSEQKLEKRLDRASSSVEAAREARAASRASWPVRRYPLGEEPADESLKKASCEELLAMVWPITVDTWQLSGRPIPDYPRQAMPIRVLRPEDPSSRKK